jgi:uncharacterized membrane protein
MRLLDRTGLLVLPLCLGLLFFAASLTPSLVPRDWFMQGVLGGAVMAIGYLIGRAAIALWRLMELPELHGRALALARLAALVPVLVVVLLCLAAAPGWQNGVRVRMGLEPIESIYSLSMLTLAVAVFAVLVLVGYAVQWLFNRVRRRLYRYMPARTANVAGFVITATLLLVLTRDGVVDLVYEALDDSMTLAQALFDQAPPPPDAEGMTGGPGSLVDWGALGKPGRDYVTSGPDAAAIARFTGREAMRPIRVYVGRAQADSPQERADIALEELRRQGGFDRSVLIVAIPTGTGWMDPGAVDPVEYMHNGDIATIAVQYSYLQSPMALIFETRTGLEQARALIRTVHRYWRSLPRDQRPRLYMHGLSLGAWASMYGTDLSVLLDEPINGAFWAGPPFPSDLWQGLVAARDPGSPHVLPTLGEGRLVRFAAHNTPPGGPEGWGSMRIAFLQYASDAIVFYEPESLFRAPPWMYDPPAPGVSPDLRFIPVVTQFQLAVDMLLANTAPSGFGHSYYGADYTPPWVAVTDPPQWTEADTARLIAICNRGVQMGCEND